MTDVSLPLKPRVSVRQRLGYDGAVPQSDMNLVILKISHEISTRTKKYGTLYLYPSYVDPIRCFDCLHLFNVTCVLEHNH